MRKKIKVQDLRIGMFVQEFCGSWMDHPFWRTAFLLKDPKDLERIRASSVTLVLIDTLKGLDVPAGSEQQHEPDIETEQQLTAASVGQPNVRSSMAAEAQRAARIVSTSTTAIASMFKEARMGNALNADDAAPLVEEIASSVLRNPGAIISLARLKGKDEYTYMHSVAVCALMVALARQLNLTEELVHRAGMAGLLHDVGKMMIPDLVLNKPGKLTDAEFDLVKTHPEEGYRMLLEGNNVPSETLDVCLRHHEKMDGSGYPGKLKSDEISLMARMGAVCDVYDAITSNRPYKAGWDPAVSLKKMAEWTGHFDDEVFRAFVRSVGIYPTGSLVRLESGRLGVVIEQSHASLLVPRIKVFFSTKSGVHIPPELLDLSRPGCQDKIVARENGATWGITNIDHIWLAELNH